MPIARMRWMTILSITLVTLASLGVATAGDFSVDFENPQPDLWQSSSNPGTWLVEQGVLKTGKQGETFRRAKSLPHTNLLVDTQLRLTGGERQNFGIAVRADGDTYLLLRYYDQPRALEVLSYFRGSLTPIRKRSGEVALQSDTWYRMKVVAAGDQLLAKLWPAADDEPDWQLQVKVPNRPAETFALVAQDDTQVQFDWVRATTTAPEIDAAVSEAKREQQARQAELASKLKLAVSVNAFASDDSQRQLHIVPYADFDRFPVAGKLTIAWGEHTESKQVTPQDYLQQGLTFSLPEPSQPQTVQVAFETDWGKTLQATIDVAPQRLRPWRDYVNNCLNTLINHGRDRYGPTNTPLVMTILDADTLQSPANPMLLDALVRLEDRLHRRGERGTNLWYDQALLQCLYRMNELTGDRHFGEAADKYVSYFFDHCYKRADPNHVYLNGMPAWGTHVYWDCYQEQPAGDGEGNGPHEILVYRADWEAMYRQRPEAVRRVVDGVWRYHVVNKSSGLHNRHDDASAGCDFAFSGSSFAQAMAFMYRETGEARYLSQAKTIVNWHWDNRNLDTNLTADAPGVTARYDGHHCFTTVVGPHALGLLECYRLTGDPHFRDVAIAYIKAYDRYGWDEKNQTFWAMLKLDGTPVPDRGKGTGYDAFAPYGHVDIWRSTIYSYEFSLAAAQAAIAAYETTVRDGYPDAELLELARRWGSVVGRALPVQSSRRWASDLAAAMPHVEQTGGGYAEDYGRAISLFVHLYRATDEPQYLATAEKLATEAVKNLYRNGLFVGHPAKPYYENTNGVGLLLFALLELDSPQTDLGSAW